VSQENAPVVINILDKEYRVSCPENEHEALLESARYLNSRMREVRDAGKVIGMDRIAIMTALNIAHELLSCRQRTREFEDEVEPQLLSLQDKIEVILDRSRQLEL